MHKISNRIFEIFFKKTLDFLLAGSLLYVYPVGTVGKQFIGFSPSFQTGQPSPEVSLSKTVSSPQNSHFLLVA